MGQETRIGWAHSSHNFWKGCHPCSPGCAHCYMFAGQRRWGLDPTVVKRTADSTFYAPLRWPVLTPSRRIFACSWSDFFLPEADEWRDDAWDVIRRTPYHTWMVLTKHPERIADHLPSDWGHGWPHVWLGVSVENNRFVHRVETLIQVPTLTRFISAEPLLGPLDLHRVLWSAVGNTADYFRNGRMVSGGIGGQTISGRPRNAVHWIIPGGESGDLHGERPCPARRMDPDWTRDVIRQAREADSPLFVKQRGTVLAHEWGLRNRRGENPAEWPAEFRIQEFPPYRQTVPVQTGLPL